MKRATKNRDFIEICINEIQRRMNRLHPYSIYIQGAARTEGSTSIFKTYAKAQLLSYKQQQQQYSKHSHSLSLLSVDVVAHLAGLIRLVVKRAYYYGL